MKKSEKIAEDLSLEELVIQDECERDHLFFSRYFFKKRQNLKFIVNWHHHLICDVVDKIISGKWKNVVINVPPGSSKTELIVINLIARGLALNPYARFLHLSYSDDLALLNSQTARELIRSEEFQRLWPMKISDDSSSKKRWNVEVNGKSAGGVYATSLSGQITGFRAGHMTEGFQGAIIVDDPCKPEDAFSKPKMSAANRRLLSTVKSRKATPDTPMILIMQRISENDPSGFIRGGNIPGEWHHVVIPAVIDQSYIQQVDKKYRKSIPVQEGTRFSYWPYKEPLSELMAMERGDGVDQTGSKISRYVFSAQYLQNPTAIGGNLIKGEHFFRYKVTPLLTYRHIFADTAQKTGERNDYSVFSLWGKGKDNRIYLLDLIRGKWEGPELKKRAIAFWAKHAEFIDGFGQLRKLKVEDKSSGTDLIQSLRLLNNIPIDAIQRNKDKLTRMMDAAPYIESGMVGIPEDAPFINDFVAECESFSPDMSHLHDDMVDTLMDAISDMISTGNKLKAWEQAAG